MNRSRNDRRAEGFGPKRECFRKKIVQPAPAQGFSLALFGGSRLRRAPPQPPKRIFSVHFLRFQFPEPVGTKQIHYTPARQIANKFAFALDLFVSLR